MILIESKENSIFKSIKKLKDRRGRTKEGKFIVEGFRFLEEGLKSNYDLDFIIVREDKIENFQNYVDNKLLENKKIYSMKKELFSAICDTENPQGSLAVFKIKKDVIKKDGFYVLVDKVQDPGNLGSIIRTSHAANAAGVILTKGTVDLYNEKTLRSTMGSIFNIPIIEDKTLEFTKELINNGYSLVASSLEAKNNFFEENLTSKVIISVGNEGNGISNEVYDLSNIKVRIPMPGNAESLNVAAAAAIMIYEVIRQNISK